MIRSAARSRTLLLLLLLGLSAAALARGRYTARAAVPSPGLRPGDPRAFLACMPRGGGAPLGPTLGPSPTAGPTLTPGPTAAPALALQQAVIPERGNIGARFVFTLGLRNPLPVPVHLTLVNALPAGLALERVWPPTGTALLVAGNTFTATLTVAAHWVDNLPFAATGDAPPCSRSCYVLNTTTWAATWSGGGDSGTSLGRPILLLNATPTPTPATPTRTPPIFPTWPPSPTPTAGPAPTATAVPPTPSPTRPPTLGPSPTATPGS